ncbi:MAG: response regulator transcription factor [Bacteroidales bacterium]|nr:response regulator transcription factor [Bacteroidales bacterium]
MEDRIRIFIVDDHKMFREGLIFVLSNYDKYEVIGEACNGREFLDHPESVHADIILMDISMPDMDGIQATAEFLQREPDKNVIALTMFDDENYYYKMINVGVKGFLIKNSDFNELANAIEEVYQGGNYFSQELMRQIIMRIGNKSRVEHKKQKTIHFTKREREVLNCMCKGMANNDIAEFLHISLRTVEGHRANLLKKSDSKNVINLIMYAIKNKLIEIE